LTGNNRGVSGAGLANTGGGGGSDNGGSGSTGGKGGSGIVIVRYVFVGSIGLTNSNATAVTAISATFNGVLTGTNTTWDVYAYWGPTDGTNNPSVWSNTAR